MSTKPIPITEEEASRLLLPPQPHVVFGPKQTAQVFGINRAELDNTPFPSFSPKRSEFQNLQGFDLVYFTDTINGQPLTMQRLGHMRENRPGSGGLLDDINWFCDESFYLTQTPQKGFRVVGQDAILDSSELTYLEQTDLLVKYGNDLIFKGRKPSPAWQEAVHEWEVQKPGLRELLKTDWKACTAGLVDLNINKKFREKPVEFLYLNMLKQQIENTHPSLKGVVSTNARSSTSGYIVSVGLSVSKRVGVYAAHPASRDHRPGASFSCSLDDLRS